MDANMTGFLNLHSSCIYVQCHFLFVLDFLMTCSPMICFGFISNPVRMFLCLVHLQPIDIHTWGGGVNEYLFPPPPPPPPPPPKKNKKQIEVRMNKVLDFLFHVWCIVLDRPGKIRTPEVVREKLWQHLRLLG